MKDTSDLGNKVHSILTSNGYSKSQVGGVGGIHYNHPDGHKAVFQNSITPSVKISPNDNSDKSEDHLADVERSFDNAKLKV